MALQYKILVGDTDAPEIRVPATGDDSYLAPVTLDAATGNEVAFDIQYTVNKATSGDDTGLLVNQTDTASPGTSLLADFQVGGISKAQISNLGNVSGTIVTSSNYVGTTSAVGATSGFGVYISRDDIRMRSGTTLGWVASASDAFDTEDTLLSRAGISQLQTSHATNAETSGTFGAFQINQTYNQTSGTAANTDLLINRTETAVGSGAQLLADFQVGGTSLLNIDNGGKITCDPGGTFGTGTGIWFGDGDTGWAETADDELALYRAGTAVFQIVGIGTVGSPNSGGYALYNQAAAATVPTFAPNRGDSNTGIGSAAADQLSLIAGGVEGMRLSEANSFVQIDCDAGTNADTSGTVVPFAIQPTYNQASGTAANTDLLINRTETAVGSGAQLLADLQVGGTSKFSVDNTGKLTTDTVYIDTTTGGNTVFVDNNATSGLNRGAVLAATGSGATTNVGAYPNAAGATNNYAIQIPDGFPSAGANNYAIKSESTAQSLFSGTVNINKTTLDEPFFDFQATADADATSAISTLTTSGATTHHIQVEINGVTAWIAASTTDPT